MEPLLTRLEVRGEVDSSDALDDLRSSAQSEQPGVVDAVRAILDQVRRDGDRALRELTERFDGCAIAELAVPTATLDDAVSTIDSDLRTALELAADQIRSYHERQLPTEPVGHVRRGITVRERVVAVERAGCYVPGGRAVYPSTVLMTTLPARVAGVSEVVCCVPPGPDGEIPTPTLAAARVAGADRVFRVGGAQAIAALAYGTESIPAVDVIVGPGNAFVTEAKRQVVGSVGIDALAGPSEVVVIADASAEPIVVAADLLAQAEHGPGGRAILVTPDAGVADAVESALSELLGAAGRREEAAATLRSGGRAVLVDDLDEALAVSDAVAPEHLQIMTADAPELAERVRNAGAVFVGHWSSAVVGDYVAGTNHVLPTGATARFASALRVDTFLKRMPVVTVDASAIDGLGATIAVLTAAEGLTAHGAAVGLRVDALRRSAS